MRKKHKENSPPLIHRLPQQLDHLGRILGAKHGTPRNDDVGACFRRLINGAGSQTAVDLDVEVGVPPAELLDLGELGGHELLAAEAGLDRHYEDHLEHENLLATPNCYAKSFCIT